MTTPPATDSRPGYWAPYAASFRLAAHIPARDINLFVLDVGLRILTFCVLVGVWSTIPERTLVEHGHTFRGLVTYSAVAQGLGSLFQPRTSLGEHIVGGSIGLRMMRPLGVGRTFFIEWLGRAFWPTAVAGGGVFACAAAFGGLTPPEHGPGWFLLSVVLAVSVGVGIDYAFAFLAIGLNNGVWFVNSIRDAFVALASGAIVPLSLMPWGIGQVLSVTPFAATTSAPVQVWTSDGTVAQALLLQILWALTIWAGLAIWLRRIREQIVSAGG